MDIRLFGRKQGYKPHSGVIDDQLMEQRPTYRAGFALDIALSITMKLSTEIELEYSKKNLLVLLSFGEKPEHSPYTHKQIAEWCEQFWNKYCDIDAPEEIENIMSVLADVETQWDLYLANTYSISELKEVNFESVNMPIEWFKNWCVEANA